MFNKLPAVWLVPIFCLAGAAGAQTPASASAATQARPASALTYRSAFEGYQSFTDDMRLNWQEANATAGRIGGWRAYAKEAAQPAVKTPVHDMASLPELPTGAGKP